MGRRRRGLEVGRAMTDNGARAVCPTHEVGYPRGEACPYCERGEVVRAPFYSQHPGYKVQVSLADGPPKTPVGRMEVMRSLLWPHLDEGGAPVEPVLNSGTAMAMLDRHMAGAVEASANARAAESRAAGVSEARCPKCGGAVERSFVYSMNGDCWPCSGDHNHLPRLDRGILADRCTEDGGTEQIRVFRDHEVWRRWGDTEKVAGTYWVRDGKDVSTADVWDGGMTVPGGDYPCPMRDTHWVLGPLTDPHVPEDE